VHAIDIELLIDDVPKLLVHNGEHPPLAMLLDELAKPLRQLCTSALVLRPGCSRIVKPDKGLDFTI
jgi:hypothetical protein